jgi:aminoglycoside phosphotransferase family enzyme/predicted kinase
MDQQTTKDAYLEDLLAFLAQPESYPHQPDQVKHIQTHISHVFIASPFVYKLKKPVDFGFLDYSTLEKRHTFCQREVVLNRRLCKGIYLGVVSIVKQGDQLVIEPEDGSGEIIEYAVKMRELPEEYFLHRYIEENKLTDQHLDRVANLLADFYNSQEPDENVLKWGKIENIRYNTDENFSQTKQFIGLTIDANTFKAIRHFTNRYLEGHEELFEKRIEEKRIVDGHGDLHLDHIHITEDQVRIYDCIEFNERFRYGDLAVDIAYLAMDLDFANCWQAERYFVDQMAENLDDSDLHQILDFYKCYRAYIKGKVKSLQSTENEVSEEDREQAAVLALHYFHLSLRYALLGSKPIALIFMGRVGTGKSTLAEHFADKLNIDRYSSDIIRKNIAELPLNERTPAEKRAGLYSAKMSKKTYRILRDKAENNLEEGKSIILDATFSKQRGRQQLEDILEAAGFPYLFVEAETADEIIEKRLKAREQKNDVVSDARLEDFEKLSNAYEPPEELDEEHLIQINTGRPTEQTLEGLYLKLVDMNV